MGFFEKHMEERRAADQQLLEELNAMKERILQYNALAPLDSDSKLEMGSHLLISHFMYSLPVFL